MTVYVDMKDAPELVKKVANASFSTVASSKKTIEIIYGRTSFNVESYWDGGSKSDYCFVRLSDMKTFRVRDNHPFFTPLDGACEVVMPEGCVLVEHCISLGKDRGLTIYVTETQLLPAPKQEEVSEIEINVLASTGLKSSYGGISDYRFHELKHRYKYTKQQVEETRELLVTKGFMAKNKAITTKGKNLLQQVNRQFWY